MVTNKTSELRTKKLCVELPSHSQVNEKIIEGLDDLFGYSDPGEIRETLIDVFFFLLGSEERPNYIDCNDRSGVIYQLLYFLKEAKDEDKIQE